MNTAVAPDTKPLRPVEGAAEPICFLCSRFKPEQYGGVEEHLWQVTSEMARQGQAVEVLTENRVGAPDDEMVLPGLRVRRFKPFHPGRGWRWYHLAQVRWWFRTLRAHPPKGLVWATDPTTAVAAIAAGYRHRVIYNPASCAAGVAHIGRQHPQATSLHVPRTLEWLDRIACRWSRMVVISSENLQEQFERFYGVNGNVRVAPYAVPAVASRPTAAEARQRLGLPPGGFVAGFVGRLDPCKGLEFLFSAARQCGLEADDRILIVGSGADRWRLEALAHAEGLGAHVVWAGHSTDTSQLYPAMDVLVLPSFYEAFGLVMLEAMSAGVPVIGRQSDGDTVFTASNEVISHTSNGFLIRGADPTELADQLRWMRSHPADRASMGEQARRDVAARTWTDVVRDYLALLSTSRPAHVSSNGTRQAETGLKSPEAPHITILASRFWPERYGGVEERLWNVANFFVAHGCDVDVLTENTLDAAPEESLGPQLRIRRFPKFAPGRLMWRWYYGAQMLWWYRVLRSNRPTGFVWATDPTMAVAAVLLGYRKRLIYNPADCVGGMDHIRQVHRNIDTLHINRTLTTFDRIGYSWSRWVMVSSNNVRSQFSRFYHARANVSVCPHGVVVPDALGDRRGARAGLGLPANGFVAGFVGRLDGCKGLDYLVKAIRAANFGPDDRVLIAGNGPDEPRLRAIAQAEGVEHFIVWAGRVASPAGVYAAIDVLVLPSVFEAFGLVLLEAMAAGLPCVARSADGVNVLNAAREIIADGETGVVTDTTDPQSLGGTLAWLRDHPDARAKMGARAREYARTRTWDRLIEEYFEAIEGLRPQMPPRDADGAPQHGSSVDTAAVVRQQAGR